MDGMVCVDDVQVEPDTDAERAAKFLLYENLLESLEGESY